MSDIQRYDIVEIPKDALEFWWHQPFDAVWDAASDGNTNEFTREVKSNRCQCPENRALLRRGERGQAYLLRQNW